MLKAYLESSGMLTQQEINACMEGVKSRTLNKLDFFVKEGDPCREVAFITSGVFRSYYRKADGEEVTYCILFPGQFIASYASFITGNLSRENIQAITPAQIQIISGDRIKQLSENSLNWMRFLKNMAEQQYLELENRIFQFQRESAAQRYAHLVNHQPEYLRQIPLQFLSSYLGITQRHLSRLRKGAVHADAALNRR